ncbi:hypothetical protein ERO13_D03G009600v2 [Gossypium hirsutum]|nr:hypothetical protein ERO13_D03G009600v2 [Gossypium hirsutum]
MKTSNLCMPRFKGNNKNKRLSPMTLFERFREAIFRLIMLSALTKTSSDQHFNPLAVPQRCYHQPDDAVAVKTWRIALSSSREKHS